MSIQPGDLIAGLIFGGVGFVAFTYGKRMGKFQTMGMGVLLCAYPYFTPSGWMQWAVGAGLCVLLWFFKDD